MCNVCNCDHCVPACPNYTPSEFSTTCTMCEAEVDLKGLPFEDSPAFSDSRGNIFCSKECAMEYYGINSPDYPTCEVCGEEIDFENKFILCDLLGHYYCSEKCAMIDKDIDIYCGGDPFGE